MQAASDGIDQSRAQLDYFRLSGEKGVAIDLEQPGFAFAAGATERVDCGSYNNTFEPTCLKNLPPACQHPER